METNCSTACQPGIYNQNDLFAFLKAVREQQSLTPWQDDKGVINLWNDIDLHGEETPYGADLKDTFNGNHHTVSGLKLSRDGYAAFFSRLTESGIVKNLHLIGTINTAGSYSGLVGINHGLIQSCSFKGDHSGRSYLGGIAGFNEKSGRIIDCCYEGNIAKGTGYCSGITGLNEGLITMCRVKCNIESSGYTGLITGLNRGLISSCTCSGSVSCKDCYSGGLAGDNFGEIENCDCCCDIFGANFNIGGIASGNNHENSSIRSCTFTGMIQSATYGGIVGTNDGKISSCICNLLKNESGNPNDRGGGIVARNNQKGVVIACHNENFISKNGNTGRIAASNQGTLEGCTWRGSENERGVVKGNDTTLRLDV